MLFTFLLYPAAIIAIPYQGNDQVSSVSNLPPIETIEAKCMSFYAKRDWIQMFAINTDKWLRAKQLHQSLQNYQQMLQVAKDECSQMANQGNLLPEDKNRMADLKQRVVIYSDAIKLLKLQIAELEKGPETTGQFNGREQSAPGFGPKGQPSEQGKNDTSQIIGQNGTTSQEAGKYSGEEQNVSDLCQGRNVTGNVQNVQPSGENQSENESTGCLGEEESKQQFGGQTQENSGQQFDLNQFRNIFVVYPTQNESLVPQDLQKLFTLCATQ
jgi:hypothetical protein